jgi:hypothetical protein
LCLGFISENGIARRKKTKGRRSVMCLWLASLIARALVLTVPRLAIKLFYCNASKEYVFAAQKDAETLNRFNAFG